MFRPAKSARRLTKYFGPEVTPQSGNRPLKVTIYVDGSWLYHSIFRNRELKLEDKYGAKWWHNHCVDWNKIPGIIAKHLQHQLRVSNAGRSNVEVTKTAVFTSSGAETDMRSIVIKEWQACNFDVYTYLQETRTPEKCVDIRLAVEMLYTATLPGAFDVAVLVSGDKDFAPALQKTRMVGKRTAICSIKNTCSSDLVSPDWHTKDFSPIWLNTVMDALIIPRDEALSKKRLLIIENENHANFRADSSRADSSTTFDPQDWNIQEDLKESQDSVDTSTRSRIKELSAGFEQTGSQVSYKTTTLQKAVDQTDDRFKPQAAAAEPSEERRPKFKTPSVFAMMVTSSGKSILMSQLSSLSLKELLCECEYRGISQLGSKDELVARLRDHVDK